MAETLSEHTEAVPRTQQKLRLQDILREGLCVSLVTAHGRFLSCRGDGTTAVGDVFTVRVSFMYRYI